MTRSRPPGLSTRWNSASTSACSSLEWIEEWADERDCEYVALANVLDNDDALEFYEDSGMETWGYVEKELG